jgi:hypothetical protein
MKALVLAVICVAALHGQARTFQYGERVDIATFPTEDAPIEAIIVAGPGDAVQLSRGGIIVNGQPARNLPATFLEFFPDQAVDLTVGSDEYLVAMRSTEIVRGGEPPRKLGTRSRTEVGRVPTSRIRKSTSR